MNLLQQLNRFTKVTLAIALALILYGYLCRWIGIYFFWESDYIGAVVLVIAAIGFLVSLIKRKKAANKKVQLEKVIIGILVFVTLLIVMIVIVFNNSDAYAAAKKSLQQDEKLKAEIGTVSGLGFIPIGNVQVNSSSQGTFGIAEFALTAKGDRKFKDLTVLVVKHPDKAEWEVESVE